MPSEKTINETKNKKTKKIKLRLEMLVGLQLTYLLNVLGMSSKSSCATLCHFNKSKFSFTKQAVGSFSTLSQLIFAVRIAAPLENNRSTAEELGGRVFSAWTTWTLCFEMPLFSIRQHGHCALKVAAETKEHAVELV